MANARQRSKFYEKVLGGKIEAIMPYEGSPMAQQVPPERLSKIMHARLRIGDETLTGSDSPPDRYEPMQGFSVTLGTNDPHEAERVFHALSESGTVQSPSRKPSGRRALACSSTSSELRG